MVFRKQKCSINQIYTFGRKLLKIIVTSKREFYESVRRTHCNRVAYFIIINRVPNTITQNVNNSILISFIHKTVIRIESATLYSPNTEIETNKVYFQIHANVLVNLIFHQNEAIRKDNFLNGIFSRIVFYTLDNFQLQRMANACTNIREPTYPFCL